MKAIQKIEEILGVKLEKNTYSLRNEHIERLQLDDLVIDDFSKLFPYLEELRSLKINNSTIPNFSQLLHFDCYNLRLDNVKFQNNNCDTKGKLPGHLIFSNMKFDAACLKCFTKSNVTVFRTVEFRNCHIENIQYINEIDSIYWLTFNKITFTHKYKKTSKKTTRHLSIHNSNFEDITFLPFKDSLENIEFDHCQIGSIAGLTKFPKLKEITIDSDTIIEDKSVQENPSDKKIIGVLNQSKSPLNLRMITSFKQFISELKFNNYKGKKIDFIEEFENIKHLSFYKSKVYVDAFLPIAKQIETIYFSNSTIKKHKYFRCFENLTQLETASYGENSRGLKTLKKLLPLKRQLKVLDIYERQKLKASHLIKEFEVLESLKIDCKTPIKTVKNILTLKNLKKLSLRVESKKITLNLKDLKQLEFLILETKIKFTGFEHLKKLKSLKIGENYSSKLILDINSLPRMESLKRLNLDRYDYEIKGLEQFPNLEYLKIRSPKIRLGRFENLKVLDLENSSIKDFSTFKKLPTLEKLDLSSICSEINLDGIHKFPNLKYLSFLESNLIDISLLEPLKKLEYLDLFSTEVEDIRVLNTLPNLKGVNTSSWSYLEEQLDKPEIAVYYGFLPIYFKIWEEDEFGI